jgi:hypothetical protein
MTMRNFITLVENILMEASGTFGFYHPETKTEIETPHGADVDHADYVAAHPEEFNLAPDQIPTLDNQNSDERMDWMAAVLDLTLAQGWVRINQYRGAWAFQGRDEKAIRRTIQFYDHAYSGITEANVDVGLSSAHPDTCFTLQPYEVVQRFIKTGARPR